MTTTFPGVVKGWHLHDAQWDNIVCVKGMIKLVLFDGRGVAGDAAAPGQQPRPRPGRSTSSSSASTTRCSCACRPGVWHGWKCVSLEEAYIVNAPTEVYRYDAPDQRELPHDTPAIPYDWGVQLR